MSFTSYAQNYEDVMLIRALRGVEHGFYIDVGAQDPVEHSVTKAFYNLGWHGINIEPVKHWFDRLVADRPHDLNLQLAASDRPGRLHLYEITDTGLSTANSEFAERHAEKGFSVSEIEVDCLTLDEICQKHFVELVHFLKIDCEGAEAAVLSGFALTGVRPWIILVEATEPLSQTQSHMDWESWLTERSYHLVYRDGLNRFYVADEHGELDQAFSQPPNVFDDFVRAPDAFVRQQLDATRDELRALRDVQRMGRIESEAEHLRAGVEYLRSENERREAALVGHRRKLEESAAREAAAAVESHAAAAQWRTELEVLRNENDRIKDGAATEAMQLRAEVGRLHHEVLIRDREVVRLHEFVRLIQGSISWRITLPLRVARRGGVALLAAVLRVGYGLIRWFAHLARPLIRWLARWSWLRSVAVRILGPNSKLAATARLFLFGAAVDEQLRALPSNEHLTRRAAQILLEIQEVRSKRPQGNGSPHSGRK